MLGVVKTCQRSRAKQQGVRFEKTEGKRRRTFIYRILKGLPIPTGIGTAFLLTRKAFDRDNLSN